MNVSDPRLDKVKLPLKGILEVLLEEKLTSVDEMAELTHRSESTVRRWVRRESWPDVIDFHALITGCGPLSRPVNGPPTRHGPPPPAR